LVRNFYSNLNPAADLVAHTIETLTLAIVQPELGLPVWATHEVLIDAGLATRRVMRITLLML